MGNVTLDKLDNLLALVIIDGVVDADHDLTIKAWQHLIDTGLCWKIQGRYGRTAMRLIEDGMCNSQNN
mgnify:CR=1 FL=1